MARRTAQEVLQDIAEMADLINERTGKINYSAFSKRTGIPHPTLIRIMQGGADYTISAETAEKIMNAFQLSFAQVRGDVPIRRRDKKKYTLTDADVEMVRRIRALPRNRQEDLLKLLELNEQLERNKHK